MCTNRTKMVQYLLTVSVNAADVCCHQINLRIAKMRVVGRISCTILLADGVAGVAAQRLRHKLAIHYRFGYHCAGHPDRKKSEHSRPGDTNPPNEFGTPLLPLK